MTKLMTRHIATKGQAGTSARGDLVVWNQLVLHMAHRRLVAVIKVGSQASNSARFNGVIIQVRQRRQ